MFKKFFLKSEPHPAKRGGAGRAKPFRFVISFSDFVSLICELNLVK